MCVKIMIKKVKVTYIYILAYDFDFNLRRAMVMTRTHAKVMVKGRAVQSKIVNKRMDGHDRLYCRTC